MNNKIEVIKSHNCNFDGNVVIDHLWKIRNGNNVINLKEELLGIDIVEQGSSKSVGKAAAGAGLGFLLAGPFGTAIGALAGSSEGMDTLMLSLTNQRALLIRCSKEDAHDILMLQTTKAPSKSVDNNLTNKAEKECPECAESIKLKAKVCRYCGYNFSDNEISESLQTFNDNKPEYQEKEIYDVVNIKGAESIIIDSDGERNDLCAVGILRELKLPVVSGPPILYYKWLAITSNALFLEGVDKKEAESFVKIMGEVIKLDIVPQGTIKCAVYTPSGDCFVATAVYQNSEHPDVAALRLFRDEVLTKSQQGRNFIKWYYINGPRYAKYVSNRKTLRKIFRLYVFPMLIVIINTFRSTR